MPININSKESIIFSIVKGGNQNRFVVLDESNDASFAAKIAFE